MGEVMVPAGREEEWIRHLIDLAGDPTVVTTSHGPIGLVFYAPDDVIDAFNARLASGAAAPAWGNGAPLSLSDEQATVDEITRTDDQAGAGATQPKRRGGRPKGSKNKTDADLQE